MKIIAHTLVHNEENFIWFVLSSVVSLVDKIMVWDTGSDDRSVEIVKLIAKKYPGKIKFKEIGEVDADGVTLARQKMLERSDCDWILILDGDEVWTKLGIKELTYVIKKEGKNLDCVVVPFYNLVGDIYHFQEEIAGQYSFGKRKGHLQVKAINRKIKGLHVERAYPLEGYFDGSGRLVQESRKIKFIKTPYFHLTHLKRSSRIRKFKKYKLELGESFSNDFKYPEVFSSDYPGFIRNPWKKMSTRSFLLASAVTPFKKIKRRIK